MPDNAISLDYTSRDFQSIKSDMIRTIPHLNPEWTDLSPADPGITLINLTSGAFDVLHEYIDRALAESFLPTAVKRESVIKLLNLIGYELSGRVGAETIVKFALSSPVGDGDIPVPKRSELETIPQNQSDSPIKFETDKRLVLAGSPLVNPTDGSDIINVESASGFEPGLDIFISSDANDPITRTIDDVFYDTDVIQTETDIPQGYTVGDNGFVQTKSDTVTATQGQSNRIKLGESTGEPDQVFVLENDEVLEGSDTLIIDEGVEEEWTEVDYFSQRSETDKIYTSTKNTNDHIIYRTGDGNKAKIPSTGAEIFVEFRTGIGKEGNIGSDTLKQLNETITFRNQPVSLNVTNIEPAIKGSDRESKTDAKFNGPADLRTQDRAVIDKDYILLAKQYPGVATAKAEPTEDGFGENVYVVLKEENERTQESADLLKQEVEDYLDDRSRVPVNVLPPEYISIQVGGEIVYHEGKNEVEVRNSVQDELESFFEIGGNITGFESNIYESDIIERLDNIDSIHHVNLERLSFNPMSTIDKRIWNGDSTFSYIDVFQDTSEALWVVQFNQEDTNQYTITQVTYDQDGCPVLNEVNEVFLVDQENTISNDVGTPQVRLQISSGQVPNAIGDVATFKTSRFKDNIIFEDKEFPLQGNNLFEYISLEERLAEVKGQT